MLSVDEAIDTIIQHAGRQPAARVNLDAALGLVLAEDVRADLDSPPFDKALMDGFAVRASDLQNGQGELRKVGVVTAGSAAARTARSVTS